MTRTPDRRARYSPSWIPGMRGLIGTIALLLPAGAAIGQADQGPGELVAAVHVHSTVTSGSDSLRTLARQATRQDIDVLVLAENFGYRFRYAPSPIRPFLEARVSTPTVEDYGIRRFFAEVRETQESFPDLLLIAGLEVIPFYYWTGNLWRGDLTLHDMQRNALLLIPPSALETGPARLVEGIPAVGNPYFRRFDLQSLALLLPGLVAGALALRSLRRRAALWKASHLPAYRLDEGAGRYLRAGPTHLDVRNGLLLTLLASSAALLWVNYPFATPRLRPYDGAAGPGAYDAFLDYANRHGALAFWSMPQAVDHHDRGFGPVSIRLSTDPYPEVLAETDGYTGFGGVYADTVTLWEAGNEWDRVLAAFQRGERQRPAWVIGESAFHGTDHAGKKLGDVLTVLLAERRSVEAAFEALGSGRSYALRRDDGAIDLRLSDFSLRRVGGSANSASRAGAGQTLTTDGEHELSIAVVEAGGGNVPVRIEIIRNGVPFRTVDEVTPARLTWPERLGTEEDKGYFRVVVRASRGAYLVSNPVFFRRSP